MVEPEDQQSGQHDEDERVVQVVLDAEPDLPQLLNDAEAPQRAHVEHQVDHADVREGGGDDPPVLPAVHGGLVAQPDVRVPDSPLLDEPPDQGTDADDAAARRLLQYLVDQRFPHISNTKLAET